MLQAVTVRICILLSRWFPRLFHVDLVYRCPYCSRVLLPGTEDMHVQVYHPA